MNSQDTIEDLTLYQDMILAKDSERPPEAAETEDSPHHIGSASHTSQSSPECKKDSQDEEEDKGCMRGLLCSTAESSPHSKFERILLLVAQLEFHLTQLKERMEETANSINNIVKDLDELKNDLRNDVDKPKDLIQRREQERGILKRAKEERDVGYQPVGGKRREEKRARVTWEG